MRLKKLLREILSYFDPKILMTLTSLKMTGRWINWSNPQTLDDKINWLKFNSDTSLWTLLSDKLAVRDYVESKGLKFILVKLYGKWDSADEIDFDNLPKSFVLKTNHGSGTNIIVKDKSELDFNDAKKKLGEWLKLRFGWPTEPHYLKIEPVVIAEEFLVDNDHDFSSSLIDYKVWCLSGKPYCIWACYSRTVESVYVRTYDLNWNYRRECSIFTDHYREGKIDIPKPQSLTQMLDAAKRLSEGFPEVRVDFYEVNGKLYFGELTFTSNRGCQDFFTKEFLLEMGSLVDLSLAPKLKKC